MSRCTLNQTSNDGLSNETPLKQQQPQVAATTDLELRERVQIIEPVQSNTPGKVVLLLACEESS